MSSVIESRPSSSRPRARATTRWLWIAVVSIVIHLLLLDALPRIVIEPVADERPLEPLTARLMPQIVPDPSAPLEEPTPKPAPRPRPAHRPSPRPIAPKPIEPLAAASADPVPDAQASPNLSTTASSTMRADSVPVTPAATDLPSASQTASSSAAMPAAMTPPLSARLEYEVVSQNVKEANPIYGNATLTWATGDGHYVIELEVSAKALFFDIDVLSSRSEGLIETSSLAPVRYIEKTRKRSMLATNFNRDDRQSVTFSASTVSVPLLPGAQDRLSILFEIGGLLLTDPTKAVAGTRIEVPVANVRDEVERWVFTVIGAEVVETGLGRSMTTHLQRTPKPGSNDRTIDLWVVTDGGYPSRVLYTEPSGSTIMMTLHRIGAVQ